MPNPNQQRRRERRCHDSHAPGVIYVVRLYQAGRYSRTLTGCFSAQSAAEFVRCYNRLSRRTDRTAKAEALLLESA